MKIFNKVIFILYSLLTLLCLCSITFAQKNIETLYDLNPSINNIIASDKDKNLYEVYENNKLLGYSFITSSFAEALGFSSAEFKILIYMSLNGNINNAVLLDHSEPLFLYDKGEIGVRFIEVSIPFRELDGLVSFILNKYFPSASAEAILPPSM